MSKQKPIEIGGVMLRKSGSDTVVEIDVGGTWYEVIRERSDGQFSHIVEPSGMRRAIAFPTSPQATPESQQ